MNMNSLLESLYQNDINAERLEKTAEAKMLNNLATGTDNPYEDWTVEELVKAAQEIEALENGEQALYEIEEETVFEEIRNAKTVDEKLDLIFG